MKVIMLVVYLTSNGYHVHRNLTPQQCGELAATLNATGNFSATCHAGE